MIDSPTPAQQTTVQANLTNMWQMVDYVHSYAIDKINNAYLLQSQPQDDQSEQWVVDLLGGAVWAITDALPFPGVNFVAGLLSGTIAGLATSPPTNFPNTFAEVWQRFDATFLAVETQLASLNTNVVADWNTSFVGTDGRQYAVSDLANTTIPDPATQPFQDMANAMIKQFELNLWQVTLRAGFVVWTTDYQPITTLDEPPDFDTAGWARSYVAKHPAYWVVLTWVDDPGCCTSGTGWQVWTKWLGYPTDEQGPAPDTMVAYLFQDDGGGTIVNPAGIATRSQVCTEWGMPTDTETDEEVASPVSFKERPGKTIQELLATSTRTELEAKVRIAAKDSIMKTKLKLRPKQTLFEILGLKVPDNIEVTILEEKPDHFYVVLPKIG